VSFVAKGEAARGRNLRRDVSEHSSRAGTGLFEGNAV